MPSTTRSATRPEGRRTRQEPVMHATQSRAFTPARIVALVLIGVLVAGLAYLRFAPDADPVSVPDGAKAGDLILEDCDYATEKGSYAADCGTLVVPENRADPQSRLIALPVTRIRALSDHPAEPLFRLEGGPGGTNMKFEQGEPVRGRPRRRPRRLSRSGRLGRGSTAPRSRPRSSVPPTTSARSPSAPTATPSAIARLGSPTTASTLPATAWPRGSTISRPRVGRSATTRSTSSARARAPATRWSTPGATRGASTGRS